MIHLITGDGKGKTSTAVGMSIRAAGHGWKVLFAQFLKDDRSGEINELRKLNITTLHAPKQFGFLYLMTELQKRETSKMCDEMVTQIIQSDADMIVLDEILHVLESGLIDRKRIESVLNKQCEIILTGASAPDWLIDKADYVSRFTKIKHPFDKGIEARIGIEY